ncbi:hypothetical protein CALVIDRAFT_532182 [Calocera viscosa TUFC12733]|uniref:Uncharacterized protein n=1 Tax=Calocera viscosa (strain TUFC12733) TaxID=1330018 RepID=A0A167RYR6_CALVF|nr:hypothetical protein CALVIDRAFT_532182 [Calocera viscosa TUFC12733]
MTPDAAIYSLRNRLTVLKKNRGEFIKAQDVQNIYQAVVKQITKLNEIRDVEAPHVSNRLDTTLADVFNLLSLFFLTIGKNREAPATYSQIASIQQQLLDHINESGVYGESDLQPFKHRLADLRQIIRKDAETGLHPSAMIKLLERKLDKCDASLKALEQALSELSPELVPIHHKLVTIRRQLAGIAGKARPSKADMKPLLEELRNIDSKRVDGKFVGPGGAPVTSSQALCQSLLEECFDITQEIRAMEDEVSPPLKPIYDRLMEMRTQLEGLVMTHRWTLRETDLWNYSHALRDIDSMRVDGKFVDADGNKPPGQFVLLYLLRRCYGLIYRLLSSSEPVSEELMPIANKLSTVKKCLNEVLKYGGSFSPRDLWPYQLALHQIDSMRKDGKFIGVEGNVPEGQGIVMAHLNECHELLEMLKESMDDDEEP